MVHIGKRRLSGRKFALIFVDQLLSLFSILLALNLHTTGRFSLYPELVRQHGLLFVTAGLVTFSVMGFYSHIWRFASILQYVQLGWGVLMQTALVWAIMIMQGTAFGVDVYIIYIMTLFMMVVGVRVFYRAGMNNPMFRAIMYRQVPTIARAAQDATPRRRRILVIGAGVTGSQLIRDMQMHSDIYEPVAIIDDNPLTHTYRVMGVPVHGDRNTIPEAVKKYRVDAIVLAIPSATRQTIRELVDICHKTGCDLKTMPRLADLIDGRIRLADLKPVAIEDLLGRDEIVLDTDAICGYLADETVLVTGGGGSIGSELCRQIARFKPKRLVVFDIYENNAYQLQYELKGFYGSQLDLIVLIGSVRDKLRLMKVMNEYKPGVVFHAAAHKHVPLMEDSPGEAVKTTSSAPTTSPMRPPRPASSASSSSRPTRPSTRPTSWARPNASLR